jgi:hypothetical protein
MVTEMNHCPYIDSLKHFCRHFPTHNFADPRSVTFAQKGIPKYRMIPKCAIYLTFSPARTACVMTSTMVVVFPVPVGPWMTAISFWRSAKRTEAR